MKTKIYHHLDQDIFTGLLHGKSRALLLRNMDDSDSEMQEQDDRDHWLFRSCLEVGLPSIDSAHPFAIQGYTLFFATEKNMAEFTHEVSMIATEGNENVWRSTSSAYFLGHYLNYPAGVIQYMLTHDVMNEMGEFIVRYGSIRFRIGSEQLTDNCEQLWLMFPQEAKVMYVEWVSPDVDLQDEPKIFDVLAHDHSRLQRIVEVCEQYQRKLKKQKMFQSFREIWKRS